MAASNGAKKRSSYVSWDGLGYARSPPRTRTSPLGRSFAVDLAWLSGTGRPGGEVLPLSARAVDSYLWGQAFDTEKLQDTLLQGNHSKCVGPGNMQMAAQTLSNMVSIMHAEETARSPSTQLKESHVGNKNTSPLALAWAVQARRAISPNAVCAAQIVFPVTGLDLGGVCLLRRCALHRCRAGILHMKDGCCHGPGHRVGGVSAALHDRSNTPHYSDISVVKTVSTNSLQAPCRAEIAGGGSQGAAAGPRHSSATSLKIRRRLCLKHNLQLTLHHPCQRKSLSRHASCLRGAHM